MQTINESQRAACIDIDSIIGIIRISTQHQYNARELDITVSIFLCDYTFDFCRLSRRTRQLNQMLLIFLHKILIVRFD